MEAEKITPQFQATTGVAPSNAVSQKPSDGHSSGEAAASSTAAGKRFQPDDENVTVDGGDFARLEMDKARLRKLAKSIRQWDKTLESIQGHLEKMQSIIEGYVKHYPPFPPQSRQQKELIKQFNALWHLVEKLEVPPETEETDQEHDRRQGQPLSHSAVDRLGLAPLPGTIPEGRLNDTLEVVKNAISRVANKRRTLAWKAKGIATAI